MLIKMSLELLFKLVEQKQKLKSANDYKKVKEMIENEKQSNEFKMF